MFFYPENEDNDLEMQKTKYGKFLVAYDMTASKSELHRSMSKECYESKEKQGAEESGNECTGQTEKTVQMLFTGDGDQTNKKNELRCFHAKVRPIINRSIQKRMDYWSSL